MPSLELLITIIAGSGNFILGIFTFYKNPKSATNKFFAFFAIMLTAYLFSNYLSLHQSDVLVTTFWVKTVISIAVFINLSFFLLANTFPDKELSLKPRFFWVILGLTFLIALAAQTNLVFSRVDVTSKGIQPSPGPAMPLFLLHTIGFLGSGFVRLVKKYRRSQGTERSQLRMLFLGAILMFSLIIFTNIILVLVFNVSTFVNLLPVYTLILTSLVSSAIVRHDLFDLRVFATEVITLVLWIVMFSKLFVFESAGEFLVDGFVLVVTVIFGILLVKSVTSEIEQRQKLQDLTDKLKAMDKQKDDFISMAAHELRAPMTAIKGYISMIMEGDTGDIPEKARGFLADTNNITERLIRLVNNMLNVSRIEEGRLVYQMEEENLSRIVKTMFSVFASEAERIGLKYELDIPSKIKDKVYVDADKVNEVVGNLISNAVKYTDKGFVKVRLSQPNKSTVRFEVVDSGPGISEAEQKKLFQKFQRVETNVGKTTGTGLGLYISKLLIEKFKGQIGVNSAPGEGSTFWFELPLVAT